jgi:tetratricopeptide (TPR) repeat protein
VLRAIKATRAGQLALDFRKDASPGQLIVLNQPPVVVQARARLEHSALSSTDPPSGDPSLAEQYFGLASTLDDGTMDNQERAAAAYRKALESDPLLVPAIINLANIHYASDELIEAQALYEHAIGIDPGAFEGYFNLGNIHHDLGRFTAAEGYYRRALSISPGYPEVHLYLAVVLEKADRPADARIHWQSYRNLAPNGEWAELAREFSELP